MTKIWIKLGLIVTTMLVVVWLAPNSPIDPWRLFNPKKVASVIAALVCIQAIGAGLTQLFGHRMGALLSGFFGGLISSTATTAALARKSKVISDKNVGIETLTFLSATLAMLCEGTALVLVGTKDVHYPLLLIFGGPILATAAMIGILSRKVRDRTLRTDEVRLDVFSILKLSLFIVSILAVSKILQNLFGQSGLFVLTFIVSLFEIHGSIIANIQLHDAGAFNVQVLGGFLGISVAASYVSKLFLIYTLGSTSLRTHAIKCTGILFVSLILSGLSFLLFT